jgi:hypothetical protein
VLLQCIGQGVDSGSLSGHITHLGDLGGEGIFGDPSLRVGLGLENGAEEIFILQHVNELLAEAAGTILIAAVQQLIGPAQCL